MCRGVPAPSDASPAACGRTAAPRNASCWIDARRAGWTSPTCSTSRRELSRSTPRPMSSEIADLASSVEAHCTATDARPWERLKIRDLTLRDSSRRPAVSTTARARLCAPRTGQPLDGCTARGPAARVPVRSARLPRACGHPAESGAPPRDPEATGARATGPTGRAALASFERRAGWRLAVASRVQEPELWWVPGLRVGLLGVGPLSVDSAEPRLGRAAAPRRRSEAAL